MMKLKKILVPVDFSKEAELAVEWAVKLGKEERNAVIFLLHVLLPTPTTESGFEVEKVVEAEWENAEELVEDWRR
jgi:nucleotide-binding universal stress UspA family protein